MNIVFDDGSIRIRDLGDGQYALIVLKEGDDERLTTYLDVSEYWQMKFRPEERRHLSPGVDKKGKPIFVIS